MKVLDPGHKYEIENFGKDTGQKITRSPQNIQFRKDTSLHHNGCSGTLCQELLRVLIDRVEFLDNEQPCSRNDKILSYFRKALIEFEFRALYMKYKKGEIKPELFQTGDDGHWCINGKDIPVEMESLEG